MAVSKTARTEAKRATDELYTIFIHATDWLLDRPDLLRRFNFPSSSRVFARSGKTGAPT